VFAPLSVNAPAPCFVSANPPPIAPLIITELGVVSVVALVNVPTPLSVNTPLFVVSPNVTPPPNEKLFEKARATVVSLETTPPDMVNVPPPKA
jgi:hypothetical protein